jgi:hypothetical protein
MNMYTLMCYSRHLEFTNAHILKVEFLMVQMNITHY